MSSQPGDIKLSVPVNDGDHVRGAAGAPVTVVQYGDYECPDCGRAYPLVKEIEKKLRSQLRFVFRHFPLSHVHPRALRAAEAAEAAGAQGRFWEMHDFLFKHQHALEDQHLSRYARKIGLDGARFDREMAEHLYAARIQENYKRSLYAGGITGTPTFYINNLRHNDSMNLERMMAAIKRAIDGAQ
jgi:protein-disulfide isomerase